MNENLQKLKQDLIKSDFDVTKISLNKFKIKSVIKFFTFKKDQMTKMLSILDKYSNLIHLSLLSNLRVAIFTDLPLQKISSDMEKLQQISSLEINPTMRCTPQIPGLLGISNKQILDENKQNYKISELPKQNGVINVGLMAIIVDPILLSSFDVIINFKKIEVVQNLLNQMGFKNIQENIFSQNNKNFSIVKSFSKEHYKIDLGSILKQNKSIYMAVRDKNYLSYQSISSRSLQALRKFYFDDEEESTTTDQQSATGFVTAAEM